VASASAPSKLMAVQRRTRKIFGMSSVVPSDDVWRIIVAKTNRVRKRLVSGEPRAEASHASKAA
jgi:hypothetical protein